MTALAFDRRGSGPTLLLLHPLGADRQMWEPVLDRLAAERDVVAVDMPGFGGSPPLGHGATPTPAALAHAIVSGLAGVVDPPFHVAGNSLGGWVALELGLSGRARNVVAIAPAGLWPEPLPPRRALARTAARIALPFAGLPARVPALRRIVMAGFVAHPERMPARAVRDLIRAYALAPGFAEVNAAMRANAFSGLGRIPVPVTLAWPEHDRIVSRLRQPPPNVRTVILRDAGHLPMWDDPQLVAELLLSPST